MHDDQAGHLATKRGLTADDLAALKELVATCQVHDGHDVKLNWRMMQHRSPEQASDFCWYAAGALVGFAPLDAFGPECELTVVVHPAFRRRGIGGALVAAAAAEARRRGAEKLLLVNQRASTTGAAFAASRGLVATSGEYHLERAAATPPPVPVSPLLLRRATLADLDVMVRIMAICFDSPEDEAREWTARHLGQEGSREYVAELDGTIVGKIGLVFEANGVYLRAIGVLPEYRGRGYGRYLVAQTIALLTAEGQTRFSLDTATDNENALGLYQSCGFSVTLAYDYYEGLLG